MVLLHDVTAKELMAYWRSEHDKNDNECVEIENHDFVDNGLRHAFFSEAIELLCQAVEKGTFHKPMSVAVKGKSDLRAVVNAIEGSPAV